MKIKECPPLQYKTLGFLGCPLYRVGTDGSVWSKNKGQWGIRSEWRKIKTQGRIAVGLRDTTGAIHVWRVSHLILTVFEGPRPGKMDACHFPDSDVNNNRIENLRWDTRAANNEDKRYHGTTNQGKHYGVGEKNPNAKIQDKDVPLIHEQYRDGKTEKELATHYGVAVSSIKSILAGRTRKTCQPPERTYFRKPQEKIIYRSSRSGLTEADVRTILSLYRNKEKYISELAEMYNLSVYGVRAITTGRNWTWLHEKIKKEEQGLG